MWVAQTGTCWGHGKFTWNTDTSWQLPQVNPLAAAQLLWDDMQRAGFRYSELQGHCVDLADGAWLTAEDGKAFRLVNLSAGR